MELPAAAATANTAPRRRAVARATAIAAAAVLIGLLTQFLFYRQGIGLNFPLAVVALLVAAWFVPERPISMPANEAIAPERPLKRQPTRIDMLQMVGPGRIWLKARYCEKSLSLTQPRFSTSAR